MSQGTGTANGDSGAINGEGKFVDPSSAIGGGSDGGITDSAGTRFDPARHASPDSRNKDGTFRGKRGPKRGGGSSGKSRSQVHSDIKETAQFLAQGLLLFHASMAAMTKTPELELDSEEATGLAESGLTLAAMYDITPDPKLQAAILFAGQVGMIYGSRVVAIRARKAQEKEEKRKGTAGVYTKEGEPAGTTTYTSETEWPLGEAPQTIM
jgi:hypothetical protein